MYSFVKIDLICLINFICTSFDWKKHRSMVGSKSGKLSYLFFLGSHSTQKRILSSYLFVFMIFRIRKMWICRRAIASTASKKKWGDEVYDKYVRVYFELERHSNACKALLKLCGSQNFMTKQHLGGFRCEKNSKKFCAPDHWCNL